jgi:hypothetical protein
VYTIYLLFLFSFFPSLFSVSSLRGYYDISLPSFHPFEVCD